jgi:hypothetical protein
MPFFTDTNLPIGYTIIHDKWHENSKKFYSREKEKKYWSTLVHNEYENTLKDIVKQEETFLNRSNYFLKNNEKDFLNYTAFEKYVLQKTKECGLDNTKKIKILKEFWKKYEFTEGISTTVCVKFKNFSDEFEKIYHQRNKELKKMMTLHDCGVDNYLKYHKYAVELNNGGIHNPIVKSSLMHMIVD